jgi:hypothetical protein
MSIIAKIKRLLPNYVMALTVSAAVKLMPRPPALVLSKNTKMSDRDWKSATISRLSAIFDDPSSRI